MTHYAADPWADAEPSLAAKLAAFLHRHPNEWHDGRRLATIAGFYAFRTRVSDLRRAPFNMTIENRQRHISAGGKSITISEYQFVVQNVRTEEGAADGARTSSAAV